MPSTKYLQQFLPKPIRLKGGHQILTLDDVSSLLLGLSAEEATARYWQSAAQLLLEEADPMEVEKQMRIGLLLTGRLDLAR